MSHDGKERQVGNQRDKVPEGHPLRATIVVAVAIIILTVAAGAFVMIRMGAGSEGTMGSNASMTKNGSVNGRIDSGDGVAARDDDDDENAAGPIGNGNDDGDGGNGTAPGDESDTGHRLGSELVRNRIASISTDMQVVYDGSSQDVDYEESMDYGNGADGGINLLNFRGDGTDPMADNAYYAYVTLRSAAEDGDRGTLSLVSDDGIRTRYRYTVHGGQTSMTLDVVARSDDGRLVYMGIASARDDDATEQPDDSGRQSFISNQKEGEEAGITRGYGTER